MSTIEDNLQELSFVADDLYGSDLWPSELADRWAKAVDAIRTALSAGGGEAVAQAQHDNLHDNIGQAISDVLTGWYSTEDGNIGVDPFDSRNIDEITDAVIGVIGGAGGVPAGWKLVPVKPTEDMMFAAELSKPRGYEELYTAMVNAAPPLPGVVAGGEPK